MPITAVHKRYAVFLFAKFHVRLHCELFHTLANSVSSHSVCVFFYPYPPLCTISFLFPQVKPLEDENYILDDEVSLTDLIEKEKERERKETELRNSLPSEWGASLSDMLAAGEFDPYEGGDLSPFSTPSGSRKSSNANSNVDLKNRKGSGASTGSNKEDSLPNTTSKQKKKKKKKGKRR